MAFNENTRVKIPALKHLNKIGYTYLSLKNLVFDGATNILIDEFKEKLLTFNSQMKEKEFVPFFQKVQQMLTNDDLGREFYNLLSSKSGIKLIDYDNPLNNSFYCVTEMTCKNGENEFRPDITLFVNGLPLVFVEVKKPNNHGGMIAESDRMNNQRLPNTKFRRFINITQLMIFSNNMEYDNDFVVPVQGAFYSCAAKDKASFNCFREKTGFALEGKPNFYRDFNFLPVPDETEKFILTDNNCQVIKNAPDYFTNQKIDTPTNRVLTSLCSPERLLFVLRYGFAYVDREVEREGKRVKVLEKHIMRYQQLFASFALRNKLSEGVRSGIIWHTQGSGKTALAFYNVRNLTDFYASQNIVPKFYFIVDRIDLLEQAQSEFVARGLEVHTVNSRDELMDEFRQNIAIHGNTGKPEITVVNIQKFKEDTHKIALPQYSTNLQRIYFLDEAHRGYNPTGCFLANLFGSDPNSIKIALTGTPLIGEEKNSCAIFGDYIDTYYYDKSIQDGYTLKLMREEIESNYKMKIEEVLEQVQLRKADIKRERIIEDPNYVSALLEYITHDMKRFRIIQNDDTLAGMIVCETNPQAREMFRLFNKTKAEHGFTAKLILHDEDDKEIRKTNISDFKKTENLDFLIVNNMLLTGFDAPRLKKLYLGRKLKDHNLLQALTRVNRPYKNYKYGYVVDFADIKANFDQTNEAYLEELNIFNIDSDGKEHNNINSIFTSNEEVVEKMTDIKELLFSYDCDNAEEFTLQMNEIDDRPTLLHIKHTLESAKSLTNAVRTFGDDELKEVFTEWQITKLNDLYKVVNSRLNTVNLKEALTHEDEVSGLINEAMGTIEFSFRKIKEEELRILGSIKEDLEEHFRSTINLFSNNFDQDAEEFISLAKVFKEYFAKKGFEPTSVAEAKERLAYIDDVMAKIREINRRNDNLRKKYNDDEKFAKAHKRIVEKQQHEQRNIISDKEVQICHILNKIKTIIDDTVYTNEGILKSDPYFEQKVLALISTGLVQMNVKAEVEDRKFIQNVISREYLSQYHTQYS